MEKIIIKTFSDFKENQNFKNLFLGNHCNRYDYKKKKIEDLCIQNKHYWDDYKIFLDDINYIDLLYKRLLKELIISLNKFHECKKSDLFWEIIVGPWLIYFCLNIFDRWKTINNIIGEKDIFTELNDSLKRFVTPNSLEEYIRIISTETYNHCIYSKILIFLKNNNQLKINFIENKKNFFNDLQSIIKKKENTKSKIKVFLRNLIINLLSFFTKKQKIVILRNYLGLYRDLKINLSLLQFPSLHTHHIQTEDLKISKDRKNFYFKFDYQNLFENFLFKEIMLHIPTILIEKFDSMQEKISQTNLSKNPKLIFVTNFSCNTFLSFYCANKKENGAKLITAQHGGCYGQYDNLWDEDFEIKISDKYLTYGWISQKYKNKTIPFGFLKNIKIDNKKNFKNKKQLLFIVGTRMKFINTLDSNIRSHQKHDYLNNCYNFIENLDENIQKNTLIRLKDVDWGWSEHPRFKTKFPKLNFDSGLNNIYRLMKSSRVVVSTSLGTSYLESLAMNIPTIVLTNYNMEPMREEAKEYLNLLIDAKILHLTFNSAVEHLNKFWQNIDQWWLSEMVQENIKIFCEKYAKYEKNIDIKLIKLLKSNLND